MNGEKRTPVIYWDASAVLSVLLQDNHSREAQQWVNQPGHHLLSTLSYSEVTAVLFRIRRERVMAEILVDAAAEVLESGPWRRLNTGPGWKLMKKLSNKWPLRGADLWHLAMAKTLQDQLPELQLLTFDSRLQAAVQGEGMEPKYSSTATCGGDG